MRNNQKKRYRVPVYWSVNGSQEVDAWTEESARREVEKMDGLPTNGEYSDGSFEIDFDGIEEIDRKEPAETGENIAEKAPSEKSAEAKPVENDGIKSILDLLHGRSKSEPKSNGI